MPDRARKADSEASRRPSGSGDSPGLLLPADGDGLTDLDRNPSREYWYSMLTLFPFGFFPILTIIAVLSGLIVPYLNGVYDR